MELVGEEGCSAGDVGWLLGNFFFFIKKERKVHDSFLQFSLKYTSRHITTIKKIFLQSPHPKSWSGGPGP